MNNSHLNKYQSVIAFDPKRGKKIPLFRIFDLDEPGIKINLS